MPKTLEEYEARGQIWRLKEDSRGISYAEKVGSGEGRKKVSAYHGAKEAKHTAPREFEWRVKDGERLNADGEIPVPVGQSGNQIRYAPAPRSKISHIGQAVADSDDFLGSPDDSITVDGTEYTVEELRRAWEIAGEGDDASVVRYNI